MFGGPDRPALRHERPGLHHRAHHAGGDRRRETWFESGGEAGRGETRQLRMGAMKRFQRRPGAGQEALPGRGRDGHELEAHQDPDVENLVQGGLRLLVAEGAVAF